jgi:hydroxymethylpyrimidine kinase/phosphomethylpyrimidine kinase
VSNHTLLPAALTIAGSDSGGGAGIQADLKTFAALGVHGTSAITAVTAQNAKGVVSIQMVEPSIVGDQIMAVTKAFRLAAVKSGMLYSSEIVEIVASEFARFAKRSVPRVVDPVAISTSGANLLKPGVLRIVQSLLLPAASLVTPNLAEAEMLTGMGVSSIAEMRIAARKILETYGCAALVKGGHLKRSPESVDIYFDGKTELLLQAPRLQAGKLHGTGCTYSAAIAGYGALGCDLPYAVQLAKEYITQAIAQHHLSNQHVLLNHLPE